MRLGRRRQRILLEEEGVAFKPNGHVDMQRHLWEPEVDPLPASPRGGEGNKE